MFRKQKIKDEKIDIKLCGGETGGDGLRTSKPMYGSSPNGVEQARQII